MPRTLSNHPMAVVARHRRRAIKNGTLRPSLVDAEAVRTHVRYLQQHGLSATSIASAAGISPYTIWYLFNGDPRRNRPPARQTTATIAELLLAVQPHAVIPAVGYLNSTGTQRRLQALIALGWSAQQIDTRLGVPFGRTHEILLAPRVKGRTARAVRALYASLSESTPDGDKAGITRARNWAARQGWAPPIAWDDDTIDDPTAEPAHLAPDSEPIDPLLVEMVVALISKPLRPDERAMAARLNDDEKTAVIVKLRDAGYPFSAIGELIHMSLTGARERYLRHVGRVAA